MRRRTRSLNAVALAAAVSIGFLSLAATPASAAPAALPEGDTLFGIACTYYSSEDSKLPTMQLIELNAATAEGVLVGPGTPSLTDVDCGGQGAWNPVTSTAYALAQDFDQVRLPALVTIDPRTGISTLIGDFTASDAPVHVYSIAISPSGAAYAMGDADSSQNLYTLDLGTGDLTLVASTAQTNFTLAFDPSSGILYTVDYITGAVATVNSLNGNQTVVGALPMGEIYSFAIDTSGTFWFAADVSLGDDGYEADLYSVERTDLTAVEFAGTVSVDGASPYIEALLLAWDIPAPAPQLAATGSDVEPVALGSALVLLLAGIAAVAVRRSRRA